MSSLVALADKAPIVPTFSARALRSGSAEVRDTYAWHAATYVEQPALSGLRQAFVDAVKQAKTPKACLVAPFGYGKTASAIGLWNTCSQANLLVVPPISCGSFTELASAIYSWLAFTLTESAQSLADAHDTFLVNTAESLAHHDERAFGIPFDQGLNAIRDKLERGYLDFDDVSINLLAFLEQATTMVTQAGFAGLVVIIDEFQQLLGNANKGVLVALRQLIWGLRTRQIPFGLVLTMDPDTERTLSDRAGDILHRIKDDGLYLDIRHIYDRDFPGRLWQQYVTALGLSRAEQRVVDNATLESLGQLCERDDLSNGPRTVINVLQRAAACWENAPSKRYSPIDLIDDLLNGTIRFDGDRGVVPALVADLLNFPYFQRSTERMRMLKLIAAFPRGCPEQVAAHYDLSQSWHELNDDLRGEIITETEEGLALIELQRVGRPANRLNILLRRYWMQITDQQLFAEDAARVFRDLVLPLLFPAKVHDLNGWSGVADIDLTADNTYAGIIVGTSSTAFPLRRIAVSVRSNRSPKDPSEPHEDADLTIIFHLDTTPEAISSITMDVEQACIVLTLALARVADQGLYGSVGWIAHYLSPHPISAAIVLGLLRYLGRERLDSLPERDQARIEDTLARLREWLLSELFPTSLFDQADIPVVSAGAGALKELLYQFFTRRWPTYEPLARFTTWTAMLGDYIQALSQINPAAQLGEESVTRSKTQMAELFGQKRHAGFDSYARQYGALLQIETWKGDDAAVRLIPLPAELQLAERVRMHGTLVERIAYTDLRASGFAAVEATQIIRLAAGRGLVKCEGENLITPEAPTSPELDRHAQTLRQRAAALQTIPDDLSTMLAAIDEHHEQGPSVIWYLKQAEQRIAALETQAAAESNASRESLRRRVMRVLPRLAAGLPEARQSTLQKHLAAAHRMLDLDRNRYKEAAESFVSASPQQFIPKNAETLVIQIETWDSQAQLYERWIHFAQQLTLFQATLLRLGESIASLNTLRVHVEELSRKARSVQSEIGLPGFAEVDLLQANLTNLLHQFDKLTNDRCAAYEHVARTLTSAVANILELPNEFPISVYDPSDDDRSFQTLRRSLSNIASRTIALMEVSLVEEQKADTYSKTQLTKLRKLIRDTAHLARDPNWLLDDPELSIRAKAAEKIRQVRRQLAVYKQSDTIVFKNRAKLVAALSDLPIGPTDVGSLLERMNGTVSRDELFTDLLKLHEAGMLRLTIDLPGDNDA